MRYATLGHLLADPDIGGWAGLMIYAALGIGFGAVIGRFVFGKKQGATDETIRNGTAIGAMLGLLAGIAMNEVKPLTEAIADWGNIFLMLLALVAGVLIFKMFQELLGKEHRTWALLLGLGAAFMIYMNLAGKETPEFLQMFSTLGAGFIFLILIMLGISSGISGAGLSKADAHPLNPRRWGHEYEKLKGRQRPAEGAPLEGAPPTVPAPTAPLTTPAAAAAAPPGQTPISTKGVDAMDEALDMLGGF